MYGAGPSMAHLVHWGDGIPLEMHIDIDIEIDFLILSSCDFLVVFQIVVNGNNP